MSRQTLQHALIPVKSSSGIPMREGNWIQLEHLVYEDSKRIERTWERCIRKKARPSAVDGKGSLISPYISTNWFFL